MHMQIRGSSLQKKGRSRRQTLLLVLLFGALGGAEPPASGLLLSGPHVWSPTVGPDLEAAIELEAAIRSELAELQRRISALHAEQPDEHANSGASTFLSERNENHYSRADAQQRAVGVQLYTSRIDVALQSSTDAATNIKAAAAVIRQAETDGVTPEQLEMMRKHTQEAAAQGHIRRDPHIAEATIKLRQRLRVANTAPRMERALQDAIAEGISPSEASLEIQNCAPAETAGYWVRLLRDRSNSGNAEFAGVLRGLSRR